MTVPILFLDDKQIRFEKFSLECSLPAKWVQSSAEAIEHLRGKYWDLVCLDHDLVGDDNGMIVVDWINEHRPSVGAFIVHSTNVFAAMEMITILRLGGYFVRYSPIETDLL